MVEHFCKSEWLAAPFNRPENFEIHAHKTFQLRDQFKVNSWVRCKTGLEREGSNPVVLCEQDINTVAAETDQETFSTLQMNTFFGMAADELDNILDLYFPG